MDDTVRLTRQIHYFVRGWLDWDEAIALLKEIGDSEEWIDILLMDMELNHLATETDFEI